MAFTKVFNENVGTGDGATTVYNLSNTPLPPRNAIIEIRVNGVPTTAYSVTDESTSEITFNDPVPSGHTIYADYVYGTYSGLGAGTSGDPYQVATSIHLDEVRYLGGTNVRFSQTSDIDLTFDTQNEEGLFYDDGKGWFPIGAHDWQYNTFVGIYDGHGYEIRGMKINRLGKSYLGLFGYTSGSIGGVKNVVITDCDVTGDTSSVAGLAGYADGASLYDCRVQGAVSGSTDCALLVGRYAARGTNVYGNYAAGTVTSIGAWTGLVIGRISHADVLVRNCGGHGIVNSTNSAAGAFVGATATVGQIDKCYIAVELQGDASRVFGQSADAVTNSFYDNDILNITPSVETGTPKTTSEMKDKDTFTDLTTVGLGVLLDAAVSGTALGDTITTTEDLSAVLTADDQIKITDGTNTEIHTVVSATSDTITISGTLANSYSNDSLYDVTDSAWDMVLKVLHDGAEETGVWYIEQGVDYPELWHMYEEVTSRNVALSKKAGVRSFAVPDSISNEIKVTLTDLAEAGQMVYLLDFHGNVVSGETDSSGEVIFGDLVPGRVYTALWVRENV